MALSSNSGGSVAEKDRAIPMLPCEARDPAWWMPCLRSDQCRDPRCANVAASSATFWTIRDPASGWSASIVSSGMQGLPTAGRKVPCLTPA
jgi:hypothetical protein